jgi:hypothetical protein
MSTGKTMDEHRGKAETAVAERTAAVATVSSTHHASFTGLVRLLARMAAHEYLANEQEEQTQ